MGRKRVLVIGWDGATLQLIRPWVAKGRLPNVERLMKEGSYGVLDSVIRPGSPQAWSSFVTGKNPGKHGIFNFIEKVKNSYRVTFINAKSRAGESVWKILSRYGLRVGVINVPISYPPEKVNGVFLSGLDAPGVESEFTYPPDLYKELRENVGEYLLEAGMWGYITGGRYEEGLARLDYVIEQRFKAAKYLYEKEKWDFFMVVFTAPDRVQHNFWKFMDPTHPLYTEEGNRLYGDAIQKVYVKLDEKLGKFLEMADQDTALMIMSDHGMGKNTDKAIYLNRFLEARGLLTFKNVTQNRISSRLKRMVFVDVPRFVRRQLWKRLHRKTKERLVRLFPALRDRMTSVFLFSPIDMARTKVYADETRSILWVNVQGRDPQGTVAPQEYEAVRSCVIDELKKLKDPDTGQPIVERVYRREEVYHGPFVKDAPDLMVMWHNDEYRSRPSYTSSGGAFMKRIERDELEKLELNLQANADHRMDGILFLRGEGIKQAHEIKHANIMDLAPTILALFDLPIPEDMDGKVIEEAFEPGYLQEHPVRFSSDGSKDETRGMQDYSDDEADIIRSRLQGLGYLE
jgi:predicted AlkP superfamily phosphohydrolase/phosphomutase